MAKSSNYSIIVDAELDLKKIEQQLKGIQDKEIKIPVGGAKEGAKDVDNLKDSMNGLNDASNDTMLTYQAANEIFQKTIDLFQTMVAQVYELDGAITDLKKVTDLQGEALNDYVDQLSKAGSDVARTGKPNRSEPVCRDGKAA